ncbi:MAG: MBOAT family protein [Leptospirales bacterium]|nr:MBOAT family protein [Leptospirales bacterium]
MTFNSLSFVAFFPTVLLIYYLTPRGWRWLPLLLGSAFFYAFGLWKAKVAYYFLLLCASVLIDYFSGLAMEALRGARRSAVFWAALLANFSVLFIYKYFDFFNANLAAGLASLGIPWAFGALSLILPIGISFHTFQGASYLIEVYRGDQRAEKHFGYFALYILYFPQLVAGPIERPQNLLQQLRLENAFRFDEAREGLKLMLWGLFKKVVVADRLAIYVTRVYGGGHAPGEGALEFLGFPLLAATYFFAFQVYCDFSGYTDIAIGAARVMGIRLMQNFRTPYFSASHADYWRRWHISLSGWFRDYVYFPLGGNRVSELRGLFNLMVVFLVSGLWHGANWTYVAWGAVHGIFVLIERIFEMALQRVSPAAINWWRRSASGAIEGSFGQRAVLRLTRIVRVVLVFHVAVLGYVFFRAPSMGDAWHVITHALAPVRFNLLAFYQEETLRLSGVLLILILVSIELIRDSAWFQRRLPALKALGLGYLFWAALAAFTLLAGVFGGSNFVYFQF